MYQVFLRQTVISTFVDFATRSSLHVERTSIEEPNRGGNDVSINEAAAAKCRDIEGEGERAEAATPCWGGIREPLASCDWSKARSETSIRCALVLSPNSSRSFAFDLRIATDRQRGKGARIRRLMASLSAIPWTRTLSCHFPRSRSLDLTE